MGTVIFPEAPFKFYLDASPEVRARRQWDDLRAAGHSRRIEDVLEEVLRRDAHDRERDEAPLRVPAGAEVLHTDDLSIDEVVALLYERVRGEERALEREPRRREVDSGR